MQLFQAIKYFNPLHNLVGTIQREAVVNTKELALDISYTMSFFVSISIIYS